MTTLYVSDIKTSIALSSRHLNLYRDLIRCSVDRYVEALKEGEPYRPFQIR